ncbi:MAG: hypothetical protein ACLUE8_02745 [Lachnospiraceae bacterium]
MEAVKQSLEKLSQRSRCASACIHGAVGAVTEDDVMPGLARSTRSSSASTCARTTSAKEAAERDGVDIRLYRVIYQAIEDIEKAMKGLLAPEYKEVLLGHAEVQQHLQASPAWAPWRAAMCRTARCSAMRRYVCSATTLWFTKAS